MLPCRVSAEQVPDPVDRQRRRLMSAVRRDTHITFCRWSASSRWAERTVLRERQAVCPTIATDGKADKVSSASH